MRLVIADDSPEMRWFVRSTVGHDFSEVFEAGDGRELFWELLRSEITKPRDEILVTDVWMPSYNGLDVLDAWRELKPRAPTIVITAFPSDEVRRRADQLGAMVLSKPFTGEALRRAVSLVRGAS
jgi:DNA-binding response OmpR family regulator